MHERTCNGDCACTESILHVLSYRATPVTKQASLASPARAYVEGRDKQFNCKTFRSYLVKHFVFDDGCVGL